YDQIQWCNINRELCEGAIMINLFTKDASSTATVNKKKEKQEARRQKAQARGQKPIKRKV
ncbi:MAG: hypothetical protein M0Q13_11455, partial [Methanothrix sp.]|nr:hypothetical protein [Methanothrix sp.]